MDALELPQHNSEVLDQLIASKNSSTRKIALFLTGRPLPADEIFEHADAVIVSWLPGSEGGGVADLLFGQSLDGQPLNFKGSLPFDWPSSSACRGNDCSDPRFKAGFGLRYKNTPPLRAAHSAHARGIVNIVAEQ